MPVEGALVVIAHRGREPFAGGAFRPFSCINRITRFRLTCSSCSIRSSAAVPLLAPRMTPGPHLQAAVPARASIPGVVEASDAQPATQFRERKLAFSIHANFTGGPSRRRPRLFLGRRGCATRALPCQPRQSRSAVVRRLETIRAGLLYPVPQRHSVKPRRAADATVLRGPVVPPPSCSHP